jgi:predicted peroxiredoxin
MSHMQRLVVKLTSGTTTPADTERCAQALTVAATAISVGADVSVWLTGDASWFAVAGREPRPELAGSADLLQLRDEIMAAGSLTVCTQCAQRRGIAESDLVAGARIAGAATFVEESLTENTQALVY